MNINRLFNKIQYFVVLGLVFLPFSSEADGFTMTLNNPLGKTKTLTALISQIINVVITIATPIAILAIIYSGFLFVKAQGNPSKLEEAKKTLMWVLVGVMVLLGAELLSSVIGGTIQSLK